MLTKLTEVLSGAKNAGKFFHTVDVFDPLSQLTNIWKVDAIDQKIKDFIESQLKVMEAASSAITSGLGLHASLSNIMVAGKLASGSEMLYAYKLFMMYYNAQNGEENQANENEAECIVAKNRHGETSVVRLGWDGAHTRFSNLDDHSKIFPAQCIPCTF